MYHHRTCTFLAVIAAGCTLTGCVSGSSDVKVTGRHVGATTVEQIEPGVTTESWVLATLGEPSSRSPVETIDGPGEIWRYDWDVRDHSSGWVFPFVTGSSKMDYAGAAYVELRDGIVIRAWRDAPRIDHDDDD
ncbi:MAG: hypothetical protein KAS72_13755 [Phycisphaerales bacterium]|nr:hypothetical protein [Phycisphaerales bacterium]